jgi:hypothetical protein
VCPCGNDDGQLVEDGGARSAASLAYFLSEARCQSRSCLPLACVADCWHVARSVGGCAQYGRVL